MTNARPRWEWPTVTALLLLAFALRVLALNDVPPGLHHDEVIIGQVAKDILRGNLAIYFTAGYGHEPLYHYIVAGFFAALGASAFALRLTSACVAMLGLAVAYRFTRRLFSPAVAIGTLAWMSISLWPVFFARVGLRGITLPLLTTLTAYFLWRALHTSHITPYVVAGALLGLTLYTYQASRVFPVIFAVFFIYLAVTRSSLVTRHSPVGRKIAAFFVTALLIAVPLIIYLTVINPAAEERVADLSGPLNQLRAGNPSEVIQSTLNTLGMFTVRGDAVPIYNVADRPVFPEPIGAALFYLGFLICLWRWRQPAYVFMLIWFFISLVPAMVTPFSPNFVRTIAAWPVPFVFVGVAMNEVWQWVVKRFG
ncbi:MAG: glycosyltransferase family 39 protein, partial [Anaerolineae bacterium]